MAEPAGPAVPEPAGAVVAEPAGPVVGGLVEPVLDDPAGPEQGEPVQLESVKDEPVVLVELAGQDPVEKHIPTHIHQHQELIVKLQSV